MVPPEQLMEHDAIRQATEPDANSDGRSTDARGSTACCHALPLPKTRRVIPWGLERGDRTNGGGVVSHHDAAVRHWEHLEAEPVVVGPLLLDDGLSIDCPLHGWWERLVRIWQVAGWLVRPYATVEQPRGRHERTEETPGRLSAEPALKVERWPQPHDPYRRGDKVQQRVGSRGYGARGSRAAWVARAGNDPCLI